MSDELNQQPDSAFPKSVTLSESELEKLVREKVASVVFEQGAFWIKAFGITSVSAVILGLISAIVYVWGFVDYHAKSVAEKAAKSAAESEIKENQDVKNSLIQARKIAIDSAIAQLSTGLDLANDLKRQVDELKEKTSYAKEQSVSIKLAIDSLRTQIATIETANSSAEDLLKISREINPEQLARVKQLLEMSMSDDPKDGVVSKIIAFEKSLATTTEILEKTAKRVDNHAIVAEDQNFIELAGTRDNKAPLLSVGKSSNGKPYVELRHLHVAGQASVGGNLRVVEAIHAGKSVNPNSERATPVPEQ